MFVVNITGLILLVLNIIMYLTRNHLVLFLTFITLLLVLLLTCSISRFIVIVDSWNANKIQKEITLARNKAPWWWSDKIETCQSVLKCFKSVLKVFYMKLYVHSLVDELKWFCANARCYNKIYHLHVQIVLKFESLYLLKPSGPVRELLYLPFTFLHPCKENYFTRNKEQQ